MPIIVLSNHTRIGAWVTIKFRGYTVQYHNCHVRVSYKHRIHGKPGLQLCLQKNQNAPRPSEFVTLHVGSDGFH